MAITLVHDCDVNRRPVPQAKEGDYRDTWLNENNPTVHQDYTQWNAGVFTDGGKGSEYAAHALFWYDVYAFIPKGATVTAAVWWFYVLANNSTGSMNFQLNRIVRTWKEAEATWNVFTTGSSWTLPGALHATDDHDGTLWVTLGAISGTGWKNFNVLSLVFDAIASRGGICTFMMRRLDAYMTDAGRIQAHAKEYEPIGPYSPHLRITYTLDGRTFQAMVR